MDKIFSVKKMNRFNSGNILCLHMELWSNSLRRSGIALQIGANPTDSIRPLQVVFILYPFFNNDWTLTAILLFKEKAKISYYNILRVYYQNNQSVHKNRSIGKWLSHRPFTAVSGVRFSMLRVIAVYSLRRYSS